MLAFLKANSKAIAAVIGAVLGILASQGAIPEGWNTPETQAGVLTFITALTVWLAPANT